MDERLDNVFSRLGVDKEKIEQDKKQTKELLAGDKRIQSPKHLLYLTNLEDWDILQVDKNHLLLENNDLYIKVSRTEDNHQASLEYGDNSHTFAEENTFTDCVAEAFEVMQQIQGSEETFKKKVDGPGTTV